MVGGNHAQLYFEDGKIIKGMVLAPVDVAFFDRVEDCLSTCSWKFVYSTI